MDAYPPDYVAHNLPFIVLSGLGTRKELEQVPPVQNILSGRAVTSVSSELPVVIGDRANELLQEFLSADGTNSPWNGRTPTRRGLTHSFRIRSVGRDFHFPPKKADAPTSSAASPSSSPTIAPVTSWVLHSPISPLSPVSPIYPDGVFTPSWVGKHQHYVPSVFISFFSFTTDPITNSLHDNQLKSEINKIKSQIQKSDYRTRYVVVLLSDKTILESPEIEERLSTIRRATALDPKTSFFFLPPNTSQVELRAFVTSVLTTLSPICVEYYRDLTKHARRKKGRGSIPAPTAPSTRGTSQPLTQTGWGVRYDFKLGVFAEFRQEMDAAQRHYNIALDSLFVSEGLFETTASWSPRWDEIRLLADSIAFRHIRCQLWNNSPTSAVQTWLKYKSKLKEVIDRRGKGSANYGWSAWESRWACAMAQMIQRAELPHLKIAQSGSEANPSEEDIIAIYLPPEKQFPVGERIPPWELLHHPGYWYKIAADHAKRRYIQARDMPEEDRTPPGMSPAARVSNRSQIYDPYLVPEPHMELPLEGTAGGFEHWKDIVVKLNAAIVEFQAREQDRKVEQLQLEAARTLLHVKQFEAAFKVLKPLWERMTWRKEGWYSLASEVLWGLHECALRVNDAETYIATEWELHFQAITGKTRYKYDLMACLKSLDINKASDEKVKVSLDLNNYLSCLSVSFTFSEGEGNVGEPLPSQIVLASNARSGSAPITLSQLAFQFKGCLSEVVLSHQADDSTAGQDSRIVDCVLEETISPDEKPRWSGVSDLMIHPGQSKIFSFPITFREAGEVEVASDSFLLNAEGFDLDCAAANLAIEGRPTWWLRSGTKLKPRKLNRDLGTAIKVLPKPPKMEIRLPDIRNQYFTDEYINISIEILNKEEDDTEAVLEVRLLGRAKDTLGYSWMKPDSSSPLSQVRPTLDGSTDVDLPGHVVGQLAQGAQATERIRFKAPPEPADYALEVKVLYHILSDRDIPISKTMIADLVFNAPFEASYDLTARVHSDPWPSYFELQEAECNCNPESTDAFGIAQMWGLRAKAASFADEPLVIKDMTVGVQGIHGGATCAVSNEFESVDTTLKPQEMSEWSFGLDIRKHNLEERRSTSLDTELRITWQRSSDPDSPAVTSSLPIPRIQIPSSEPRVLGSILRSTTVDSVLHLDYTLENPTMHFLTFELNMEASEEFGFSGAKLRTLHLLPMSRQTVRYNILPLVEDAWMTPNLRVVDRYFNKTLKVQATEGLKQDKQGITVWIPGKDGKGPGE